MGLHVDFRFHPHQVGRQAGIVKIHLGAFYQSLAYVGVKGLQEKGDIARFQYRQPMRRSGMGDADIIAQGSEVEQLSRPACQQAYEFLEGVQIAY